MSQYPTSQNYGGPPPGPGMYEVAPATSGTGANPVGRAALGVGLVTLVVQAMGQVMLHTMGFGVIGWFGMSASVFGLVATVLGIIGLQKRGAAKGAAGVGFGIGIYVVVMAAVNLLANFLHYGL